MDVAFWQRVRQESKGCFNFLRNDVVTLCWFRFHYKNDINVSRKRKPKLRAMFPDRRVEVTISLSASGAELSCHRYQASQRFSILRVIYLEVKLTRKFYFHEFDSA